MKANAKLVSRGHSKPYPPPIKVWNGVELFILKQCCLFMAISDTDLHLKCAFHAENKIIEKQ